MKKKVLSKKLNIFLFLIFLLFSALIARLGYLQLLETEKYKKMADTNRLRPIPIQAPRGKILDRNQVPLADSKAVYTVSLAALELKDPEPVIKELSALLNVDEKEIKDAIKAKTFRSYEPIIVKEDVSLEKVMEIQERRQELPGVVIDVTPLRNYPQGTVASTFLGYLREKGTELKELQKKYPEKEYRLDDKIGLAGLEKYFESYLKGTNGYRWFEVDSDHNPIREMEKREPVSGNNLHLTIDFKLQKAAEEALDTMLKQTQKQYPDAKAGAVVLIEVNTGRVLAMASKPDFDPNIFNGPINKEQVEYLFNAPTKALSNRSLYPYPPGSTFKMVTTGAALRTNALSPTQKLYDPGYIRLSSTTTFKCWKPGGHGAVDAVRNLQVSCNVFTGLAAERAGSDEVAKLANEFGFGNNTGISLPNENSGLIPTADWKRETQGLMWENNYKNKLEKIEQRYDELIKKAKDSEELDKLENQKGKELRQAEAQFKIDFRWNTNWQRHDTLYNAIGQGQTLTTPLQLANYAATIANGGTLYKPYLVDKITDVNGKTVKEFSPEIINKVKISKEDLQTLQKGMLAVTQPGGTAYSIFRSLPVKAPGKTGTSQVTNKDNHGLFVGYAPYDNPQVAAATIIEYGGAGGSTAGVVTKDVFAAFFNLNEKTE